MPYRVIVVTDPHGTDQMQLDARNAAFWDELCGSSLAKSLGIDSIDRTSLRRFDVAYMTLYPYLSDYLELDRLRGERVLEIGLGFGTVSQLLAASGAVYHGVDIAPGPVETVRSRLKLEGLPGVERVVQASASLGSRTAGARRGASSRSAACITPATSLGRSRKFTECSLRVDVPSS